MKYVDFFLCLISGGNYKDVYAEREKINKEITRRMNNSMASSESTSRKKGEKTWSDFVPVLDSEASGRYLISSETRD